MHGCTVFKKRKYYKVFELNIAWMKQKSSHVLTNREFVYY